MKFLHIFFKQFKRNTLCAVHKLRNARGGWRRGQAQGLLLLQGSNNHIQSSSTDYFRYFYRDSFKNSPTNCCRKLLQGFFGKLSRISFLDWSMHSYKKSCSISEKKLGSFLDFLLLKFLEEFLNKLLEEFLGKFHEEFL